MRFSELEFECPGCRHRRNILEWIKDNRIETDELYGGLEDDGKLAAVFPHAWCEECLKDYVIRVEEGCVTVCDEWGGVSFIENFEG